MVTLLYWIGDGQVKFLQVAGAKTMAQPETVWLRRLTYVAASDRSDLNLGSAALLGVAARAV